MTRLPPTCSAPVELSRRRLLTTATALTGVSVGAAVLPASLRQALAATVKEPPGGSLRDIELWRTTLFILTYDENDGLFDHVPPPVAPPGTPGEYVGSEPIGLGFRVPADRPRWSR